MIKKILGSWLIQLFCIFWAAYLFLDYINYSGYLLGSFNYFEYSDLIFTVIILVVGITYFLSNRKKFGLEPEIRNFRGIYHYVFVLFLMALIMIFYLEKMGITNPVSGTLIFIFRTIIFHAGLVIILLAAMSTGSYLLALLPLSFEKNSSVLVSLAIGFFVITIGLFLLGAMGLLYQFVVIPFVLLLIIPGWKKTLELIKGNLLKKSEPLKIHFLAIFAYAIMILLIAVNLTIDTRTFPLGYDSLNLYMNVPKLIAGYHSLTSGGDAYNWSLMMSLGFIMYNNTTIALLISVVPGILCLFAIYRICINLQINRNWSLFASALFYSLPNTIWQSKNDEKTDLAMLFISLCCILIFTGRTVTGNPVASKGRLNKLFPLSPDMVVWALCGCLIGFTFGIKYVAMLSIFAFLVVIFYNNAGKYGAIAVFFLNFALIFALDLTKFAAFERDLMFFRFIVPFVLFIIALILTFINNRHGLFLAIKKTIVFCVTIGLTFLPWAIKNITENKKISFDNILTGKSSLPDLFPVSPGLSGIPGFSPGNQMTLNTNAGIFKTNFAGMGFTSFHENSSGQLAQNDRPVKRKRPPDLNNPYKKQIIVSSNNEKVEEIRRYLGYETGIIRFVSLPYDIVMRTNVQLGSSDTGILLLIIIPAFIFVFSFRQLPWNIIKMIFLLFILIVSLISVQIIHGQTGYTAIMDSLRSNSFSDTPFFRSLFLPVYIFIKQPLILAGNILMPVYKYLTIGQTGISFIIIVLSTIPFYLLFKSSFAGIDVLSKSLIAFVYCLIQYWLILASGIIWYGIVGFSLIPVIIALVANKGKQDPGNENKFIKRYICICSVIWFVLILPFQFMPNQYLYATDMSKINCKEFMDRQFVKYAIGAQDEREVFKQFFSPAQQNMIKTLNHDKDSYVMNISTYLNYFIVNNDTRIYMDNQLGIFKEIYDQAKDDRNLLPSEFKKKKIKYILVGLSTARIDKTPDKSLTKKFNDLMNALVNNPEVRLLYTNRIVERPDGDMNLNINGQVIKAKYDVVGERILDPGSDALFEIL